MCMALRCADRAGSEPQHDANAVIMARAHAKLNQGPADLQSAALQSAALSLRSSSDVVLFVMFLF